MSATIGGLLSRERDSKTFLWSMLVAFAIEALVLFLIGWHEHWIAHPQNTGMDESRFIEAQVYEIPPDAHLVSQQSVKASHEQAISKKVSASAAKTQTAPEADNQTQQGQNVVPNHGPVAVYAPAPAIPTYFQDKDLHVSVVIDFFVNAQGQFVPQLVGSSGYEELDAIAIATVKKWQFRAAEKDHHPIDAKVRLRIVFDVR